MDVYEMFGDDLYPGKNRMKAAELCEYMSQRSAGSWSLNAISFMVNHSLMQDYVPSKLHVGCAHPDPVVETASLAAVEPPDINYQMHLDDLIEHKLLSGLQLESIVYACQRHQQLLPDESRAGFFIGDGAGVGKGRTIAGGVSLGLSWVEVLAVGTAEHPSSGPC